jgi:hypothetical protein
VNLAGTETVLLAEDHDSTRGMVRQSLESLGYRVLCAANGKEALQLCERETQLWLFWIWSCRSWADPPPRHSSARASPTSSGYSEAQDESIGRITNSSYLQKPYRSISLARALRQILESPASVDLHAA